MTTDRGLPEWPRAVISAGMSNPEPRQRVLNTIALIATFVLPLGLTHFRGVAEVAIDVLAGALLLRSFLTKNWVWLRAPWFVLSLVWWSWQMLCSIPLAPFGSGGWAGFFQSLAAVRFILMVAALESWTLSDRTRLRQMAFLVAGCGAYIAVQIAVQALFGHNLFGVPRFHDGTLTGPYTQPRAAAPLSRLFLPILMMSCAGIAVRWTRWRAAVAMGALCIIAAIVMVLAGQRMPLGLFILGLGICAVFFRPIRPGVIVVFVLLPVFVFATEILSPGSFRHLVLLGQEQLSHFGPSPYGRLLVRSLVMVDANPLTGLGYDAFRHGCADPAYFHGLDWLPDWLSQSGDDGGLADICRQHAHNHYLEAATNAGLPGLGLFIAMITGWLVTLWPRSQAKDAAWLEGLRIGAFAAVFIQEWPFASTSDFMNLPLGGWAFVLLALGLAARPRVIPPDGRSA